MSYSSSRVSSSAQRDLVHQYSLPLAVLLVVASMEGLTADLRQGRLWLTRRLLLYCFRATLSWALLAKPGYFFDRYRSRVDQVRPRPAHDLTRRIPSDAAVLTKSLRKEELSHLDIALLNRHDPG